jgi:peptidoglycan/xylan/chitin deacetylase (PgdA/CDA1 family)
VRAQQIALTFDDGPGEWTEPILDILAAHSAHATFFVIGSNAKHRPDVIRRMDTEGHEIGNHTWSHPYLARDCDDSRVRDELERTNAVVAEIVGRAPRRFRAPHYDASARVISIGSDLGLAHTCGDVTPPDWDARCTAPYITTFVVQQARARLIVGLHDGLPPDSPNGLTRQATVDAVGLIVPRLFDLGLECVTAETLLGTAT